LPSTTTIDDVEQLFRTKALISLGTGNCGGWRLSVRYLHGGCCWLKRATLTEAYCVFSRVPQIHWLVMGTMKA
jgi:hypothetical protein